MFFADDGKLMAEDVQTLQRMYEAVWVVTKVTGLKLQMKAKKKTAWYATYWEADGTEKDIEGWTMRMPDKTVIPQLTGDDKYVYLGTELSTGWAGGSAHEAARAKVVRKCRQVLGMIGRAPLATEKQVAKVSALGYRILRQIDNTNVGGLRENRASTCGSAPGAGVHHRHATIDGVRSEGVGTAV